MEGGGEGKGEGGRGRGGGGGVTDTSSRALELKRFSCSLLKCIRYACVV